MKVWVSLFLLAIAFSIPSCSKAVGDPNTAANSGTVQISENESSTSVSNQSPEVVESTPPSNPRDRVVFDGTNYIKKNGWLVPSSKGTNVTKKETEMGTTNDGSEIEVITTYHDYKTPKSYSENFYHEGPNLANVKGRLISGGFTKYSAHGKTFMYSIFAEKVVPPPASNSDPHVDPFVYQIMDTDGDGIFETLRGEYEIIVPNWVLK